MSYSGLSLDAEQRKQLHEVADGMLRIYETLAEMRYLNPRGITRGPHDLRYMNSVYAKFALDPAIIYLYSILPYLNPEAGQFDFFHGGRFADFRDPATVERGRDPLFCVYPGDFDPENDQFMRPWATPLSVMGNHGTVIIYDARQHRIWVVDQETWGTTDLAFHDEESLTGSAYEEPDSDWGDDSTGDYAQSDEAHLSSTSEGSSEFWSDEEESALTDQELVQLRNDQTRDESYFDEGFEIISDREHREAEAAVCIPDNYSLHTVRSRHAGDVLRDINRWFRELKEGPGFTWNADEWSDRDVLKSLYLKNGWPSAFDGDAFEIDQARAYHARNAKYDAEEPLRVVERYQSWLEFADGQLTRQKQKLSEAQTDDEEWTVKFELWQTEHRRTQHVESLRQARQNADLKCPEGKCQREEDLPLWELQSIRQSYQGEQDRLKSFEEDPTSHRLNVFSLPYAQKSAAKLARVYQASLADAERLCPGRTFEQATGLKFLGAQYTKTNIPEAKQAIAFSGSELRKLRDWAAQVPEAMVDTTSLLQAEIKKNEEWHERNQKELERQEKWLAEHGNVD